MPRKYELRQRAARQEETRRRIIEAAVALHETVGTARTTISDIATRAGVERATVYRHFPDERSLFTACTGHYLAQHPPPDPAQWSAISDPITRLHTALREIFAYHRRTERMVDRATRDLPDVPALAEALAPNFAYWAQIRDGLAAAWLGPEKEHALVAAGIGHAIAFSTWQSLVRAQGLDEAQAIEMLVTLVRGIADTG